MKAKGRRMNKTETGIATRRRFLASAVAAGAGAICARALRAAEPRDGEKPRQAQLAVTLDLELSPNVPVREDPPRDY